MKKKWKWLIAIIVMLLCIRACGSLTHKKEKPIAVRPTPAPTETKTPTASAPAKEEITVPETTVPKSTTAETEAAAQPEKTDPAGIRPEFKEAMDSYEAFYDEYCDFMEKYAKNPTDPSLLGKYAGMLSKAEEMNRKFEAWNESDLSNEELKYYLDVTNRVQKKMLEIF